MGQYITLGDLLHQCAEQFAARPFITEAESGKTLSYAEFETLTNRFAHGLKDHFCDASRYIAIMLENGIPYLVASYALKKRATIEVSINRAFRGLALARMIDLTGASILITSDAHLDVLYDIRGNIPSVCYLVMVDGCQRAEELFPDLEVVDFQTVLSPNTSHIPACVKDTDTATIQFTSGTTGVSKGCVLSHRYAVRTAENMIDPFRITSEDCTYTPYPLSHVGPAYYDVLPTIMTGGRVIIRECFSVTAFWPEVKKYGVTWFMMLGSVQQLLWAAPSCPEENSHNVTRCWGTPAPVPKVDFDARFNLHLIPGGGYGSTDAGWVATPDWNHPGGKVLPHFEVVIADENDNLLPPGIPGELLVREKEAGVMSDEYFDMPEETLESRRNGWFHTGDIAKLDAEGRFYFICRISERIRVRGEMVSAFEVEESVLTHPAIEDCAAIGIESEWGEEDIKLFVVLKPGCSLSAEELRKYCVSRMAKFMVPHHIVFLDEMPRTPTGKPEKGKLAQLQT